MKKKLMLVALSVIMAFSIVFGLNACSKDDVVKYVYTNHQGEVSCFEIDFNAETYKYEGNGFYSESLEYMLRPGTSYSVQSTIYYVKTVNNQKVYNFHDHPWNYEYTFSISEDGNTLYAINGYIKYEFIKDGIGLSQNNNQTPDNENAEQGGSDNSNNDGSLPNDSTQDNNAITFIMPVKDVTSIKDYSETMVYNNTLEMYESHLAIDFFAPEGTSVVAVYDGIVIDIYTALINGVSITIDHGNGLYSIYNSLADGESVAVGQMVKQGDVIGQVSTSNRLEYKDGAHVHFEVKENGELIDPIKYLYIDRRQ